MNAANVKNRTSNRAPDHIRPVVVTCNSFGYAAGSVLFELGKTKVLCAVSLNVGVPPFLKGKKTGWLSAEYAMLPTATYSRSQRESVTQRRNGRSMEISRLIGRALRAAAQLDVLGERTITVDCDVLQADGGTRTAAISGASVALKVAQQYWLDKKIISAPFMVDDVGAISAGIVNGNAFLDLDGWEDNNAAVDFNFVLTSSGKIIEIQGATEKQDEQFSWNQFDKLRSLACDGVNQLFSVTQKVTKKVSNSEKSVPFFSLQNRLKEAS